MNIPKLQLFILVGVSLIMIGSGFKLINHSTQVSVKQTNQERDYLILRRVARDYYGRQSDVQIRYDDLQPWQKKALDISATIAAGAILGAATGAAGAAAAAGATIAAGGTATLSTAVAAGAAGGAASGAAGTAIQQGVTNIQQANGRQRRSYPGLMGTSVDSSDINGYLTDRKSDFPLIVSSVTSLPPRRPKITFYDDVV